MPLPMLQGLDTLMKLQGMGGDRAQARAGIGGGGIQQASMSGGGLDIGGALQSGASAAEEPDEAPDMSGGGTGIGDLSPALAGLAKRMMAAEEAPLTREDKGLALAQAGFGIAAGESPHALSNIGAGAMHGLDALQRLKQQRAVQRMRQEQVLQSGLLQSERLKQQKDIAAQSSLDKLAAIQERADEARRRSEDAALSRADREAAAAELKSYRDELLAIRKGGSGFDLPEGTGEEFLNQLPTSDQAVIKKVVAGDVDPRTLSMRDGYRNRIIAAASQYDNDYDQTNIAARVKTRQAWAPGGQAATSNNALDTVVGHIGNLKKDVDALNNFGGLGTALNAPANWLTTKKGKDTVTNFNTDADAVATELAKAYKGAGALAEGQIKEWRANISPNMSPDQLNGSIDHVLGLLDSKADANVKQWNDNMGARNQRDASYIYGEKSRKTLASINPQRYGSFAPDSPVPPPAGAAPPGAVAPPAGAPPAPQGAVARPTPGPNAIAKLRANPKAAKEFDDRYGPGASLHFLGGT